MTSYLTPSARGTNRVTRVIQFEESLHRGHDLIGGTRHIEPRESDHTPSVEERLTISLAVRRERLRQLMPPSGVPLYGEPREGIGSIESPPEAPGNRILEPGFREPSLPQDVRTDTFERRPVSRADLSILKNPPDLPNPRLPSAPYLIYDVLDIGKGHSLLCNRRTENGAEVPDRQKSREVDNRSGNRGCRDAINLDNVIMVQIVTAIHGHSGKLVRRPRVDEHGSNSSPQLRQTVQLGSGIVGCNSSGKRRHRGPDKVHRSRHVDDLVAETTEWFPPSISNALIYLSLGETVLLTLLDADRPTLACGDFSDCSIRVHARNMPDASGSC